MARLEISEGVDEARVALCVAREGWIFAAAIEDGSGGSSRDALRGLLGRAIAACVGAEGTPREWPERVAAWISERLAAKEAGAPPWVFYAGAALSQDEARVCTAGDLRVHLLRDGALAQVTRDHVAAHESPAWVAETYGAALLPEHAGVATRSLGGGGPPPESLTWSLAGRWSLVLCSSDVHRGQRPETYLPAIARAKGLVVRVEGGAEPAAARARSGRPRSPAGWAYPSEAEVAADIGAAREALAPGRLQALVARGPLRPAQARQIGAALGLLAEAYAEAHEDVDVAEDVADALALQAAALQVEGGAACRVALDAKRSFAPGSGEYVPLGHALDFFETWESEGAELTEPSAARVPWPAAAARDAALRLAEGALAELAHHAAARPLLTAAGEALRAAWALTDRADGAAFERLRRGLSQPRRQLAKAEAAAIKAAEEAGEVVALNRRAYLHLAAVIVYAIADAALRERPDFRDIFGGLGIGSSGRVELTYPLGALEHSLERYYSIAAAGFDEIFTGERDLQAEVARAEIERMLHAALRAARG